MTTDQQRATKAAYMREWNRKNSERINARRRELWSKDREKRELPQIKTCATCKLELAAESFYTNGTGRLRASCKECEKKRKRDAWAANPDKCRELVRKSYAKHADRRRQDEREYYANNKDRWRRYSAEHKEQINVNSRERRKLNPEKARASKRAEYERNRCRYLDYHREYYKENRPILREKGREYYRNNFEAIRKQIAEWQRNNPEKARAVRIASNQRRRARVKNADGNYKPSDILALLEKQNNRCACCGKNISKTYSVDHVMPLALGGSHDPSNLQLLCVRCNAVKGAMHPDEWAARLGKLFV